MITLITIIIIAILLWKINKNNIKEKARKAALQKIEEENDKNMNKLERASQYLWDDYSSYYSRVQNGTCNKVKAIQKENLEKKYNKYVDFCIENNLKFRNQLK